MNLFMKYSHNSNEMMDFIAQQIDNSKLSDIEIANIIGIKSIRDRNMMVNVYVRFHVMVKELEMVMGIVKK